MTDEPLRRLSAEEITVLKFASHRQLARWAQKEKLSRHLHARRIVLIRAVRTLEDKAFAGGCELHALDEKE